MRASRCWRRVEFSSQPEAYARYAESVAHSSGWKYSTSSHLAEATMRRYASCDFATICDG
jgi:hypothetical protein